MEHEYTISGRIFPSIEQIQDKESLQKFIGKTHWAEEDFKDAGLKIKLASCDLDNKGNPTKAIFMFSMNSADMDCGKLKNACLNLSLIFSCSIMLCKDHEVYGVANVFNGGSDYEVVDENCYLWIYEKGSETYFEKTKYWNEKFASAEQEFLKSEVAKILLRQLKSLA